MASAPEKPVKILVIDDEEQIRRALKSILSSRKYDVTTAKSGEEGLDMAVDGNPSLLILDLTLPGIDGIEVCRILRTWYTRPILVLSVRGSEEDKIRALDIGADDYLTKPFSAGELLARVRAQLRRVSSPAVPAPLIKAGELEIDIPHRRVRLRGQEVDLTRIEFDILAYLARYPGCVITSKMILQEVWGPEFGDDTPTLRVHISHLRKKVEPHPSVPRYILTEPGVGFRFQDDLTDI